MCRVDAGAAVGPALGVGPSVARAASEAGLAHVARVAAGLVVPARVVAGAAQVAMAPLHPISGAVVRAVRADQNPGALRVLGAPFALGEVFLRDAG